MRFKDLSSERTIIDEAPVSMVKRMGDWAKSKTGFSLKDSGQREQLKNKEKLRIWQAVKNTLLADGAKEVSVEELQDAFVQLGYGRSGKEILSKFVKDKKEEIASANDPRSTEERWEDVEKGHKENAEALQRMKDKLASVKKSDEIGESIVREANEPILLNKKEIEKIINAVVNKAAKTRAELFDREALRRQGKEGSEFSGEDRGATYKPEDSEPSVDYEKQDLDVDKEDLATRLYNIKQAIQSNKKEDAIEELEDLQDFIDNL